eukprot:scaffold72160_cov44-Prasinocladus_malaysianus.AAC.1
MRDFLPYSGRPLEMRMSQRGHARSPYCPQSQPELALPCEGVYQDDQGWMSGHYLGITSETYEDGPFSYGTFP